VGARVPVPWMEPASLSCYSFTPKSMIKQHSIECIASHGLFPIFALKITHRVILLTRFCKLLTRVATPLGWGHVPQVSQWQDACECSVVANKHIGVQMYTITGPSNHYVAVYCATHRKQFHIINHSRMIAIIATVANSAVRLSIGLRLVGFIHV